MSIRITFRTCEFCGKKYNFNPSTGNFGRICPRCGRVQSGILPVPDMEREREGKKSPRSGSPKKGSK